MSDTFKDRGMRLYKPSGGVVIYTRDDWSWTSEFIQYYIDQEFPGFPYDYGLRIFKDIAGRKGSSGSQFTKYGSECSWYYVDILGELHDIYKKYKGLVGFDDLRWFWNDSLRLYEFGARVAFIDESAAKLFIARGGSAESNYDITYDSFTGKSSLVEKEKKASVLDSLDAGDIKLYVGLGLGVLLLIFIIK
jgi:hypothetical protein